MLLCMVGAMQRDDHGDSEFRSKRLELASEAAARALARTLAERVIAAGRASGGGDGKPALKGAPLPDPRSGTQGGKASSDGRDCVHVNLAKDTG